MAKLRNNILGTDRHISSLTWLICIAALFVLKMILVANNEISALPYDQLTYIKAAANGYWFGKGYDTISYIRLPMYPLWIFFVYLSGVPLRLAMELLYLFSGLVFVVGINKNGINRAVCVIIFCLVAFHPVSFTLFDNTLPETLYSALILLALGLSFLQMSGSVMSRFISLNVMSGVCYSIILFTRPEGILVICLVLLTVVANIYTVYRANTGGSAKRHLFIATFIPVFIMIATSVAIRSMNYVKYGLFIPYEVAGQGYTAAYKALLQIKPEHEIRFVPVSKEMRESAYAVSPSFKELEPYLEDENSIWVQDTGKYMGIKGEIAAGWFYWALRDAVSRAGHHDTAVSADKFYNKIANEIHAAISDGRLKGRPVFFTFLDPNYSSYLRYIPESLGKIMALFIDTHDCYGDLDSPGLPPEERALYDKMANRRTALISDDITTISGWAFHTNDPVKNVILRTDRDIARCSTFAVRPDVVAAYHEKWGARVPLRTGYGFHVSPPLRDTSNLKLVFVGVSNREYVMPWENEMVGKAIDVENSNSSGALVYAVDKQPVGAMKMARADIQSVIWQLYGRLVKYFSYIGVGALLLLTVLRKSVAWHESRIMLLVVLLFAVASRVALFTLLDASSWPGDQPRYLFPVMPLYSCFLVLCIAQAWEAISAWRRSRRMITPEEVK